MTERADVAIIGGGILGLAVARELLTRKPQLRLTVVEREPELAAHQSGHNSGVLHAGLYYPPGSLKAQLCREGKESLERYANERGIRYELCGKLVVALTDAELPGLEAIRQRAEANLVPGLEQVGRERLLEIEPHAAGIKALWSPKTGIIDFQAVALSYAADVRASGGEIHTSRGVTAITTRGNETILATTRGELAAGAVIACAGLWSDRVAAMGDAAGSERIIPFRGDYYTLTPDARRLVRGLIYPVPDPRFPFLGVHFTKRIDGAVWAGPNAVLAFGRTAYRRRDLNLRDLVSTLTYAGFVRLAAHHWRSGAAEMWRDWSKAAFLRELQKFVPEVKASQLRFGPSGIRAQALDRDGSLVDDFRLRVSGRMVHVINAPSPAATASLAIARELVDRAVKRLSI